MRAALIVVAWLTCAALAQEGTTCSCGNNPAGRPAARTLKPYAEAPDDLRPYSKFTDPYYQNYTDLVEYNGAARDVPDPNLSELDEIRIGFLGPLHDHRDQVLGNRMLHGAQLAIDEANKAGGYCGKPFKLMLHNDSATWGASSNEVVKMVYDEHVWAMFGSISGDTTHIALRVSLKAETPLVNSASTDPTIPETIIPWYFTDLQDDRLQGYTLARHIYTELGLKRVAILRVNDRYGRFGVLKFRDASRRLGHPVVIEQKFMPGDTDFRSQLSVIQDSRADAIVIWTDVAPAAAILKQMHELGMNQRVFGSHRTVGGELLTLAGTAAEGFEAVFPYDPTQRDQKWIGFNSRFENTYHERPDHFAALAYDAMQMLLQSICRAGLNRVRIRDALTGIENYSGVTGNMKFDPNCKNISPMFLATVHHGAFEFRRITMEKPYARVGEDTVQYAGPATPESSSPEIKIAVFGPNADRVVHSAGFGELLKSTDASAAGHVTLVAVPTEGLWGKASSGLVQAVYQDQVLGIIALDRTSSHLAEQIGVKAFVPVIAISADKVLTSSNIPWIFRLPEGTSPSEAAFVFVRATKIAGANRGKIRDFLASGASVAGVHFLPTGEPQ